MLHLVSSKNVGGMRNHGIAGGIWGWISGMVSGISQRCQIILQIRLEWGERSFPRGGWHCALKAWVMLNLE